MRDRVLTALILIGVMLGAAFLLPTLGWALFGGVLLFGAALEWAGLAGCPAPQRLIFGVLLTLAGLWWAFATGLLTDMHYPAAISTAYAIAGAFWLLGAPLWLRARAQKPPAALLLLVGALVLVPTYSALVQLRETHPLTLLLFLGTVWIADIAAYFSGRHFGGRKLAPSISPGKTWAGVYGAFVATAIYALLWITLLPQFAPASMDELPGGKLWMFVCIAALTAIAIIGDLFESVLKRQAGVKDSGNLLPGHGGVLDRIDAVLPVLPLAALMVSL